MNAKELAELDLAVARAEGHTDTFVNCHGVWTNINHYQPTLDGAEAMRLLEKYRLWLVHYDHWECGAGSPIDANEWWEGDTPMEAICRAVVALKGKV